MPYILRRFKAVTLPQSMPQDDLSTGRVESGLRDSIGGVYDYYGTGQQLPRRHEFTHRGIYEGEVSRRVTSDGSVRVTSDGSVRVTAQSAAHDLQGKTDDLKAEIGEWGELWRERITDGAMQWKMCRLLQVRHVETVENANVVSEVESDYETRQAAWRAEDLTTVEVSAVNGVPKSLVVENGGAVTVKDAVLSIERTSGTITFVQVTGPGIDLVWTGSIGAGETLEIDAGEKTLVIGDDDEYGGFSFDADHTSVEWLPLTRGTSLLTVTVTGGNADITLSYYAQFP